MEKQENPIDYESMQKQALEQLRLGAYFNGCKKGMDMIKFKNYRFFH
jgi:hypothetical protein